MTWTRERWLRLEPHLDALLDLADAERPAYLDTLPEADQDLRPELERLLAASEEDLLRSLATRAPDLLGAVAHGSPEEDPLIGRSLGPYRITERIGEGGMGIVYRAVRDDEAFRQDVAVKVLRWTAGRDSTRRFRRERETLARLDHPNVTRILDGGVTKDGISYLVMELVRGRPITAYCREEALDVRRRVRLFLNVCRAVDAAHHRLIVHRDLKPSNVVVTEDGTIKVLDFGIAKWLDDDQELAGGALLTRTGERFLTPQYAAPEQFHGGDVSTATDVYALGVLLYELVTGRPPYYLEGLTPTEQEKQVCGPAPPSPASVAQGPAARAVRGDLDRVILMALRKEPSRRYASVEALADDLEAWLDGRPVTAMPDSTSYRVRRFVSRHRVGVAASMAVAAALLAGLAGTAWQARVAAHERDRARDEARHAREVVDFLVGGMEKANPFSSPEAVTVSQLLEQSVGRVGTELRDQPEVQMSLFETFGRVYSHTNRQEASLALFDRAAVLADSLHGPTSVAMASILHNKARALSSLGKPDSALVLLGRSEAMVRPKSGADAQLTLASILEDRAQILGQVAGHDSVLSILKESLAIRERLLKPPHEDLARSYHAIAGELSTLDDPAAPSWFRRAASMWRATVGDPHANLASTLNNWALWYHLHGRPDSAEVLYRQSLDMSEKILGRTSPSIVNPIINLANFYIQYEKYDEAESMLQRALGILVPQRGDVVPTAAAYANLGHARLFQKSYPGSEAAYLEAKRIFIKVFGPDHVSAAVMDAYLGRLYWKWGRDDRAETAFAAAFRRFTAQPATAPEREASARTWYGRFLMERGDMARAETELRRGYALAVDSLGDDRWERAEAETALGACLARSGNRDEGLPLLQGGHAVLETVRGHDHAMTRWAAAELARAENGA